MIDFVSNNLCCWGTMTYINKVTEPEPMFHFIASYHKHRLLRNPMGPPIFVWAAHWFTCLCKAVIYCFHKPVRPCIYSGQTSNQEYTVQVNKAYEKNCPTGTYRDIWVGHMPWVRRRSCHVWWSQSFQSQSSAPPDNLFPLCSLWNTGDDILGHAEWLFVIIPPFIHF